MTSFFHWILKKKEKKKLKFAVGCHAFAIPSESENKIKKILEKDKKILIKQKLVSLWKTTSQEKKNNFHRFFSYVRAYMATTTLATIILTKKKRTFSNVGDRTGHDIKGKSKQKLNKKKEKNIFQW